MPLAGAGAGPGPAGGPTGRLPRLRTVVLLLNLLVLLLPLGGVFVLRLYESALIRRAEGELLAQGAALGAAYHAALAEQAAGGRPPFSRPAGLAWRRRSAGPDAPFRPIEPRLDLAFDPVLGPIPPGRTPREPSDPVALAAGRRLGAVLEETRNATLAGVRLLDARGTVVASSGSELGLSLADRPEVLGALHGEVVSVLRQRESDEPPPSLDSLSRTTGLRVYVALPVVGADRVQGAVLLGRTPQSVGQSLWGIRQFLLPAAALYLLLVGAMSVYTAATITAPMEALVRRTERVARGERDAARPLPRPGTREIDQLGRAFAETAQALFRRADLVRGLASSVAHEFKTPLASLKGAAELLGDHYEQMTAGERARFLSTLEQSVARLDRLVSGLVELARADALRPGDEACEVGPLLDRLAARQGGVTGHGAAPGPVSVAGAPAGMRARIAATALEAVIGNLVANALAHGGERVRVILAAAEESRAGRAGVAIDVRDDGRGISPANQARVFEPFFTTARAEGGTGLGLSIVRSLVEAHGGEVTLRSRPGETEFRVWLPAA